VLGVKDESYMVALPCEGRRNAYIRGSSLLLAAPSRTIPLGENSSIPDITTSALKVMRKYIVQLEEDEKE